MSKHAALFLRGIFLADRFPVHTPVRDELILRFVGAEHQFGHWPAGLYYTDGSGGDLSSTPLVRRCGIGIAQVSFCAATPNFVWGCYAAMDGELHTVPRAELLAVTIVVEQVAADDLLTVVSDSEVTVNIVKWCLEAVSSSKYKGKNFGLVARLRRASGRRTSPLQVRWVKSHATEEHLSTARFLSRDIVGNAAADALAVKGAREARVAPGDRCRHLWEHAAGRMIQKRLLHVHQRQLEGLSAATRVVQTAVIRPFSSSPAALSISSQHRLEASAAAPAGLWCSRCKELPAREELSEWLAHPCHDARQFEIERAHSFVSAAGLQVVVGARTLHATHRLQAFRGIYFCMRCGCYSGQKPQGLIDPCAPPTPAGSRQLARLTKARLPSGLQSWPSLVQAGRRAIVLA